MVFIIGRFAQHKHHWCIFNTLVFAVLPDSTLLLGDLRQTQILSEIINLNYIISCPFFKKFSEVKQNAPNCR